MYLNPHNVVGKVGSGGVGLSLINSQGLYTDNVQVLSVSPLAGRTKKQIRKKKVCVHDKENALLVTTMYKTKHMIKHLSLLPEQISSSQNTENMFFPYRYEDIVGKIFAVFRARIT